jgi:hypothetical protein
VQVVKTTDRVNSYLSSIRISSTKNAFSSGLNHFKKFVPKYYPEFTIDSIIDQISNKTIDVYELLNNFVSYLVEENKHRTSKTISDYMIAIKGYLGFFDIDIISSKLKKRVKLPR